jgi:hypothetical protein
MKLYTIKFSCIIENLYFLIDEKNIKFLKDIKTI